MKIWSIVLFMTAGILLGTLCSGQELKNGDIVWAQWKPNDWYHGKTAEKTGLGFIVAFDDGDRAELPVALIVADTPPREEQLAVGIRVMAPWTGGKLYPGTIMAIPQPGGYQIQFDDGDRTIALLSQLRLLPESGSSEYREGDIVWAQWKPNAWYHGRIAGRSTLGFQIAFDDGDKAQLPGALIAADVPVQEEQLRVGSRVLARWTDDRYYPGTITAKTPGGGCAVRFDDGATLTVPQLDLRLLSR